MQPMQQQQEKAKPDELENKLRTIRLQLTREQIDLLLNCALRNGFVRKNPNVAWDINEQNSAAKWAIMFRLGLHNAK